MSFKGISDNQNLTYKDMQSRGAVTATTMVGPHWLSQEVGALRLAGKS